MQIATLLPPAKGRHLVALAAALLIVAWSPFVGGPRLFSVLLALLGAWAITAAGSALAADRGQRRLALLFALLAVPVFLSAVGGFDPAGTLTNGAGVILFWLAGVAMMAALAIPGARRWLELGLAAVLLLWLADAAVQAVAGRDLLGIPPLGASHRITGPFAGQVRLGIFIPVLLPFALRPLLARRPLWALGLFCAAAVVLLPTGMRGGWVMLFVVAPFLFRRLELPGKRLVMGAVVALVAVAAALSPVVQQRLGDSVGSGTLDFARVDRMLNGRLYLWDTALQMVRDRPLTGVGAGAFEKAYGHYSYRPDDWARPGNPAGERPYHAHQLYVGVTAETGLIGLAALLAAILLGIRWYRRAAPPQRDAAWPAAVALAGYLFPLNSQPILLTLWWFPVVTLLVALFLAALEPPQESAA